MKALPVALPDQIALLGQLLVELIEPYQQTGPVAALDNTFYGRKEQSGISVTAWLDVCHIAALIPERVRYILAPSQANVKASL